MDIAIHKQFFIITIMVIILIIWILIYKVLAISILYCHCKMIEQYFL